MNQPVVAAYTLTGLFWLSWMLAAVWTRSTTKRPPVGSQTFYTVLAVLGFGMLLSTDGADAALALPLAWPLVGVVVGGYAFCWWARLHLGSLWSGTVTTKEGHHVVDTGPYRLVRHPIYTGLIIAGFGLAFLKLEIVPILGAVIWSLSFWVKARMEEGFLRAELGAESYDAYAAKTPMLIPFWPT